MTAPLGWLESEDAVLLDTLWCLTVGVVVLLGLLVLAGVAAVADWWRARA